MADTLPAPRVSVIIPSFNAQAFIRESVSSALASEGVSVEVIVIDDGSTDDTWKVLESFGDRIRTARQERGGPYRARNLGAQLARGEWLAFLDADDKWMPDKLSRQLTLAATENVGLVYTDRLNFGDIERVKERQSDAVQLFDGDIFEPLLLGNFVTLSSVIILKDWFDRMGGFEIARRGVQDWDLWLRYSAAGGRVGLCREPLTRYRFHGEQMTKNLDQRAADRESVLRLALQQPRAQRLSRSFVRRAMANLWQIGAYDAAAIEGRRGKAILWFLRSAGYWPWNISVYKGIVKCCLALQ